MAASEGMRTHLDIQLGEIANRAAQCHDVLYRIRLSSRIKLNMPSPLYLRIEPFSRAEN